MTTASDVISEFLYETTTGLQDIDFFNKVMQFDNNANSVATGEATYIFAGPPIFRPTLKGRSITEFLEPIGAVQSYSLQEGKQVIPFSELGSKLKRHVIGSGQYSASLARVLALYADLNYSFYSWLPVFLADGKRDVPAIIDLSLFPGENNSRHFVSMESEFFGIPFGLLCITGTAGGDLIHCEYLERCYCQGGGYARAAGQPMVIDNVNVMVTRPVPFIDASGNGLLSPDSFRMASRKAYTLAAPGTK